MLFNGLSVDNKKAALRLTDIFQYSQQSMVQILAFTYFICIQITEDFFYQKSPVVNISLIYQLLYY